MSKDYETVLFMTNRSNVISTATPTNAGPDYDWRHEGWVKGASSAANEIALHIMAALAADGDTPQEEEDTVVMLLVNPSLAVPVIRSPEAGDIIRYRVAHAIAMLIDAGVARAKKMGIGFDDAGEVF